METLAGATSCLILGLGRLARSYPFVERMAERLAFYAGTFALQEALFGIENGDRQAFENGIAAYR